MDWKLRTDKACRLARGGRQRHKKNLWWNEVVNNAVNEKKKAWKLWKNVESKEEYLKAKEKDKTAVNIAKRDPQHE